MIERDHYESIWGHYWLTNQRGKFVLDKRVPWLSSFPQSLYAQPKSYRYSVFQRLS
jgi:hypothetical protein